MPATLSQDALSFKPYDPTKRRPFDDPLLARLPPEAAGVGEPVEWIGSSEREAVALLSTKAGADRIGNVLLQPGDEMVFFRVARDERDRSVESSSSYPLRIWSNVGIRCYWLVSR